MTAKTKPNFEFWLWAGIITLIVVLLIQGCASPGAYVMTKCPDDGGIVIHEGYSLIYNDGKTKYVISQYRCNFCFRLFWVTNDYAINPKN